MADNSKPTTPTPAAPLHYDLYNPTRGRRIIYDGIEGSQKPIVVERKETTHNVLLHADVVKELRERNKIEADSDLQPKLLAPEKSDA